MPGIRIRHRTLRSCVALVPIMDRPMVGLSLYECPHCHVAHPVKTVHLWLDDTGSCIVSTGVLEDMRRGWEGSPEYDIVGEVQNPPPLFIGELREKQDQRTRSLKVGRR